MQKESDRSIRIMIPNTCVVLKPSESSKIARRRPIAETFALITCQDFQVIPERGPLELTVRCFGRGSEDLIDSMDNYEVHKYSSYLHADAAQVVLALGYGSLVVACQFALLIQ